MDRFKDFPINSQIWIYQAEKPLTEKQRNTFEASKAEFLAEWNSHGTPVTGTMELFYDLFIVVCADDVREKLCGKAIASSVSFVEDLEKRLGVSLLNRRVIAYRSGKDIRACSLKEFKELFAKGEVSADTMIFNNAINSLSQLESQWEIPMKESWISKTL